MAEEPTYADIRRALAEETPAILQQISIADVQLSLPLDGEGPRIRASVRPDARDRVPRSVEVRVNGRTVSIPIEAKADYADFEAY